MENLTQVLEFVSKENYNGYGYGSGSGFGGGSSFGSGSGFGSGYGSGNGFGNCNNSDGDISAIKSYNGQLVHNIDGVATIITFVRENIAKGFIVNEDMTLVQCYVARHGNTFAHGDTLKQAVAGLRDKMLEDMPVEERIEEFQKVFKDGVKYPATDFFDWHNKLTKSCLIGRETFVINHNIDLNCEMTVAEFIATCENYFGGEIIKKLKAGE